MTDFSLHLWSPEFYFKYVLRCVILLLFFFRLSQYDSIVILKSQSRGENISLCLVGFVSLRADKIVRMSEVAV